MQTKLNSTLVLVSQAYLFASDAGRLLSERLAPRNSHNERGEGVISAAIAVLIMAILGGLMFYAYKAIFKTSSDRVNGIVTDLSNQPIAG